MINVPPELMWRWSVDQYHAMIRAGILTEDDPVELLDGWLVPKMPKSPNHRATTLLMRRGLERLVPAGWYVDSQEPITTPESEPEPDVLVLQGSTRRYLDRHPGPGDLALVVEVSDTSLEQDRKLKKALYASAGIPCYWIANLRDDKLEVYSEPTADDDPPTYRQRHEHGLDDEVVVRIADVDVGRLAVRDLFP